MKIPAMLLRQLYSFGSLVSDGEGVRFSIKNRLSDVALTGIRKLRVDGREIPLCGLVVELAGGVRLTAAELTSERPLPFALRQEALLRFPDATLGAGPHEIHLEVETTSFGTLDIKARDDLTSGNGAGDVPAARAHAAAMPEPRETPAAPEPGPAAHVPYDHDPERNYAPELIAARQRFVEERTGVRPTHIAHYSFDPAMAKGNIENFTGVAQVPIGIAGPLRVNGEHARGDFLIPLATTEGTLVASYSRGMKVLNLAGGVTCTVVGDRMQRAPVFIFDSAREARDFRNWARDHFDEIRREAEATSRIAKLLEIETYLANRFAFLRFDFATGDAAGQNMVSRATFAACNWIAEQVPTIRRFYLESNFATDKKASGVNMMRTRGKRVTAEATIPRAVLRNNMRVEPESLVYHGGVANVGAFMAGVNNNGLHSVNGITAMFIATGQDVANVAEASSGVIYADVTPDGDLYLSITIPSLIVATHGGGTKLATQRECLRILGCDGPNTARKLAEIVAGVVLAGEISLASAISSLEWVSAHEKFGRNR